MSNLPTIPSLPHRSGENATPRPPRPLRGRRRRFRRCRWCDTGIPTAIESSAILSGRQENVLPAHDAMGHCGKLGPVGHHLALAGGIDQPFQPRVAGLAFHDQPAARDAGLSIPAKDRPRHDIGGGSQIGIGIDDGGPLAAQFQPDPLDPRGGKTADDPANPERPGEIDHVALRMLGEQLALRVAITRHHIDHPIRNPRLTRQFRHADRRAGGEFAGFDHHTATSAYRPRHPSDPISSGKFHGVTMPTMPLGSRSIRPHAPGPKSLWLLPSSPRAWPAA